MSQTLFTAPATASFSVHTMRRSGLLGSLVAIVALSSVAGPTAFQAQQGDWRETANWSKGVPDPAERAVIGSGRSANFMDGEASANALLLGDSVGSGTLALQDGVLSVSNFVLGAGTKGSTGTVNQVGGQLTITYERPAKRKYLGFEPEKAADYLIRYLRFMKEQGIKISYMDAFNEAGPLVTPEELKRMVTRVRAAMGADMPLVIAPSGFGYGVTSGWVSNAIATANADFWDITSSHDLHGMGDLDTFVAVARKVNRPIWNTELHIVRGPDDKAAQNMGNLMAVIRAGFSGMNPWLSMGNEKKDYTMFRNVAGELVVMRTYYIYRHLMNTANGARYLDAAVPAPLASAMAFHHEGKSLLTVWALNTNNAPVDVDVRLPGRFAASRLAEVRWWGPDNPREGTALTNEAPAQVGTRQTMATNSLYCFTFKTGPANPDAATGDAPVPSPPNVAVVRVGSEPQQQMTFGHDFERLWHFRSGDTSTPNAERVYLKDLDEFAKRAVGECDADYVRIAISGAAELEEGQYDWSAYDEELAILRALQRANPKLKFFASPRPIHNDQKTGALRQAAPYAPYPLWINKFDPPFVFAPEFGALDIGNKSGTVGIYNLSGGAVEANLHLMSLGDAGHGEVNVSGTGVFKTGGKIALGGEGGSAVLRVSGGEFESFHMNMGTGKRRPGPTVLMHLSGGVLRVAKFSMGSANSSHTLRISGSKANILVGRELTLGGPCLLHYELDAQGVSPINVGAGRAIALAGTLQIGRLAGGAVPPSAVLITGGGPVTGEFKEVRWLDGLSGNVAYDRTKGEVRIENVTQR